MNYRNPFIEPVQTDGIYYVVGEPETVKADCKEGVFLSLGQKAKVKEGKNSVPNPEAKTEMTWQVVKHVNIQQPAVLFPREGVDRKAHQWVQVFYIDSDGLLCATLLKGESRDNFLKAVRNCETRKKKSYVSFLFTASMSSRESAKYSSEYYAVEFTTTELQEDAYQRIYEFAEVSYDDIYDVRTVREFYNQNSTLAASQPLSADMAAKLAFALGYIPESKVQQLASTETVLLIPELETA